MISGRCAGSIRLASRISRSHSAECKCMLETRNRSGMRPSSRICGGTELLVPLLQHDPRLVEAGIDQRRADRPHAGRHHPQVGVDKRQDARAMIEGAGDHRRQVVLRRQPQAAADVGHFAGGKQNVALGAAGQFHGNTPRSDERLVARASRGYSSIMQDVIRGPHHPKDWRFPQSRFFAFV